MSRVDATQLLKGVLSLLLLRRHRLLGRLGDDDGLTTWFAAFRAAQCQGKASVNASVESISSVFVSVPEYTNKKRTDAQYVGDLYNAFLRRGGDLPGVLFWINQLSTKGMTPDDVRRNFIASTEFKGRVNAVIAQGCLP